jgi:hypothetical protein
LPTVTVDLDGLTERMVDVPLPAGDYRNLSATNDGRVLFQEGSKLTALKLKPREKPVTIGEGISGLPFPRTAKNCWCGRATRRSCGRLDRARSPRTPRRST